MIPAAEALERLREGNRRFRAGDGRTEERTSPDRRRELVNGQSPFAVVVGCADSRVPPELLFDQGLGDLFVIRVAGNVIEGSQRGSVEFAAQALGTRLVVVLGHSGCGAVSAALERADRIAAYIRANADPTPRKKPDPDANPPTEPPRDLRALVETILPALEHIPERAREDPDARLREAVRANVRISAERLRSGSDVLAGLIRTEGLEVVGGVYDLESGEVDFFDGMPLSEQS